MNYSPDTSPEEKELKELMSLWIISDPEESMSKFLRITPKELTQYMRGTLNATDIVKMYHERA